MGKMDKSKDKIKTYYGIEIDTDTGKLYQDNKEIVSPWHIADAYAIVCTFRYLKDLYANDDNILWNVAEIARDLMTEVDEPISETEAIEEACFKLDVDLIGKDEDKDKSQDNIELD